MANKISKSTAYMIDLLCEGEIEGPASDGNWSLDTYFNETVVENADTTFNFDGTTIIGRTGTDTDANYLADFNTGDMVLAETLVDVEMTYAGGATARSITDDEVDHVDVTFSFPQGLMVAYDSGKQRSLPVAIKITITPTNGVEQTVIQETITKYARSEFRQQYVIKNLQQYVTGDDVFPMTVKVYRMTADRESSSKATYADQIKWYSFTEKKEVKIGYRNRAVVATELRAEDFGDNIPNRAWEIKGMKIKVPNNYTWVDGGPSTYNGTWDGDFAASKIYCNNPAWVIYDLLTNKRYGAGIDPDYIDKWTLQTISEYCDGMVTYEENTRQSDGTYVTSSGTQPRFTFNGVISDSEQALVVINHFCGVFRGFPMWGNGLISFAQDAPGTMSRIATNANVLDGVFEYEGTAKRARTTAVKVGWNDPDNFGKQDFVTLEDRDGVVKYGYNPFDFFAIGCTNRNEAILRGKMALYTNINQTELVSFTGGLEWADAIPGDIIGIQDKDYAGDSWGGRIVSATSTSITIDHAVTIAGATYTLHWQTPTGGSTSKVLTNGAGSTSTLTWTGATNIPTTGLTWVVTSTTLAIRQFRILSIKEQETNQFNVSGYEYDANKYSLVENNLTVEVPIPTTQPQGVLTPPTNFTAEPFTYVDGISKNRMFGVRLDWTASTDPRAEYYDVDYTFYDGIHEHLEQTSDNVYDWLDVTPGIYDFYVRARNLTSTSKWAQALDITVDTVVSGILPPTNLRVYGTESDTAWEGPDCHIEWDASLGIYYNDTLISGTDVVAQYKIEARKPDTTLVGTYYVEGDTTNFRYTFDMNVDNFKQRVILFYVYTIDKYGDLSDYDSESFSNAAPSMGGAPTITPIFTGVKIDWSGVKPTDTDGEKFVVYLDTSSPPTTEIMEVGWETTAVYPTGLDTDAVYYAAVMPYDGFGAGSKSATSASIEPLKAAAVDIDVELSSSITMTDSLSTTASGLLVLLDRVIDSGGIAYGSSAWVNYDYGLEYFQERLKVYVSAGCNVYVTSTKLDDTQQFFAGDGGHDEDANGYMTEYGSAGAAATGYFTLSAGKNVLTFPQNVIAKEVKLTFVSGATLYELGPGREIIADEIVADNLSAISADIGTIDTGTIQSSDYPTSGLLIDIDAGTVNGIITFRAGSTGIANTDAGDLATQNTVDWQTDVLGTGKPDDYATDNSDWEHPSDVTKIDGGELYVGSRIKLNEGGKAVFGDENVIIDTAGSHGSIIVSEDGGPGTHSYCRLSDGDINFQYWNGSTHLHYNSLTRMEAGSVQNNTVVNIPGMFKNTPNVMVSPNSIQTYNEAWKTQSQTMKCEVIGLEQYSTGFWRFRPRATLELSSGTTGGIATNITNTGSANATVSSSLVYPPANTRRIVVTTRARGYYQTATKSSTSCSGKPQVCTTTNYSYISECRFTMRLYYWHSGTYSYSDYYVATNAHALNSHVFDVSAPGDITQFRVDYIYAGSTFGAAYAGPSPGAGWYGTVKIDSYSSDQTAASVITTGSLNWMAIGQ